MSTSTSERSGSSTVLRELNSHLDETAIPILEHRAQSLRSLTGVRVGHDVEMPTGLLRPFTCACADATNVSSDEPHFYLRPRGAKQFPRPTLAIARLDETPKTGSFGTIRHHHNCRRLQLPSKMCKGQT